MPKLIKAISMTDTCHQSEGNQSKYSVTRVPGVQIVVSNQCSLSFRSSSDARATYGSRLRILRWHADVVSSSSFRVSLQIFEQKRDCSLSTFRAETFTVRFTKLLTNCFRSLLRNWQFHYVVVKIFTLNFVGKLRSPRYSV